ncbi:chondroitin AC lyase [Algoriphagus faecimaris]|uniref:Chondroitin AC lyase n=1 Tax=Algoriphagus faecimaris TaxID=686796 RepID=A0A1G6UQY1_9BACT|nr:polysaccharide lyase 8 family protein [Algoriphagus faecimaris]SDD42965.1 chondroitin AC lyase [Algoriphagus faecimaris]
MRLFFLTISLFLYFISTQRLVAQSQNDFEIILSQAFNDFQSSPSTQELDEKAQDWKRQLNQDGSWSDIDYKDTSPTGWQPKKHLDRVSLLSKAYTRKGSKHFHENDYYEGILSALRYWTEVKPAPRSTNWWWLSISVPQELGEILTSMRFAENGLPPALEKNLLEWMNQTVSTDKSPGKDGSNLTDIVQHRVIQAALIQDEELLKKSVSLVSKSIKISKSDGIKQDLSFHAHGPELYTHGYGREFLSGIRNLQIYLRGTQYSFTEEQMNLISEFTRRSFLKVTRGRYVDYSVLGRGIARSNATRVSPGIIRQIKAIDKPEYRTEYDAALARLEGKEAPSFSIQAENLQFWKSDYMVHHRPHFMASVNIASKRTIRTESGNKENLRGQFLTEGAMFLAADGDEYFNVFPFWHWYMIPGTTTPANKNLRKRTNWVAERGNADFVGGVSDGQDGISVYHMNAYRTEAKKAWFFFDDIIICLGSQISADRPEPIYTTVNQSLLKGPIWIKEAEDFQEYTPFTDSPSEISLVYHDQFAYFFPDGQKVQLTAEKRESSWSEINGNSSNKKIEKEIFSLWIDHGLNPKGSSYAYYILPGIEKNEVLSKFERTEIEVLKNSPQLQVLMDPSLQLTGMVFYEKGDFEWDSKTISLDQAGLVLLREIDSDLYEISYSDPTQLLKGKINLLLKIRGQSHSLSFDLPTGEFAGSSVCQTLSINSVL